MTSQNIATVETYDSHIRHSNRFDAIDRARMIVAVNGLREMAQWGDDIPSIDALYDASTPEALVSLMAAAVGDSEEELAHLVTSREQAERVIHSDARQHLWHSDGLKARAEQSSDANEVAALMEADRQLATAANYARVGA